MINSMLSGSAFAPTRTPPFLRCPGCGGPLLDSRNKDDDEIRCQRCGTVGKWRFGCADFLAFQSELEGALGAHFDLEHDANVAARMWGLDKQKPDEELAKYAVRLLRGENAEDRNAPGLRGRAIRRYEEWYHGIDCEIGDQAGEGTVARANASLISRGLPPLPHGVAVEAGSGLGRHLPGLARYFDTVVCVDCCLTFIVLAAGFIADAGFTNVWFVRANVERLPLATEAADLVHQNGVIEHVADPQVMIEESLRVTSERGSFVCVSPNRYPLTPEAHFKLPLFGLFPARIRAWLLPYVRGVDSEVGTDLRSLRQLNRYFSRAGVQQRHSFFVSRGTRDTVRQTSARKAIIASLQIPFVGGALDFVLNRVLLPIAPYHVVVASRRDSAVSVR